MQRDQAVCACVCMCVYACVCDSVCVRVCVCARCESLLLSVFHCFRVFLSHLSVRCKMNLINSCHLSIP